MAAWILFILFVFVVGGLLYCCWNPITRCCKGVFNPADPGKMVASLAENVGAPGQGHGTVNVHVLQPVVPQQAPALPASKKKKSAVKNGPPSVKKAVAPIVPAVTSTAVQQTKAKTSEKKLSKKKSKVSASKKSRTVKKDKVTDLEAGTSTGSSTAQSPSTTTSTRQTKSECAISIPDETDSPPEDKNQISTSTESPSDCVITIPDANNSPKSVPHHSANTATTRKPTDKSSPKDKNPTPNSTESPSECAITMTDETGSSSANTESSDNAKAIPRLPKEKTTEKNKKTNTKQGNSSANDSSTDEEENVPDSKGDSNTTSTEKTPVPDGTQVKHSEPEKQKKDGYWKKLKTNYIPFKFFNKGKGKVEVTESANSNQAPAGEGNNANTNDQANIKDKKGNKKGPVAPERNSRAATPDKKNVVDGQVGTRNEATSTDTGSTAATSEQADNASTKPATSPSPTAKAPKGSPGATTPKTATQTTGTSIGPRVNGLPNGQQQAKGTWRKKLTINLNYRKHQQGKAVATATNQTVAPKNANQADGAKKRKITFHGAYKGAKKLIPFVRKKNKDKKKAGNGNNNNTDGKKDDGNKDDDKEDAK